MSLKSKVMKKGNETIQRPISLQPGESASVVSPIYPSVVYASETPDMLDDQYEGRVQGYTSVSYTHLTLPTTSRV